MLALALAACASTPPPAPADWILCPLDPAGVPVRDAPPIEVAEHGFRLEIEPLDPAGRAAWLARAAGVARDPLEGLAPRRRFVAFRMLIEAAGGEPIHLESGSIRLWAANSRSSAAPIDYTRAWEMLRPDIETSPDAGAVERFMRGLVDGTIQLAPGAAREGLLLFPEPPADAQRFVLEFPFVHVGTRTHRVRVRLGKLPVSDAAAAISERSR